MSGRSPAPPGVPKSLSVLDRLTRFPLRLTMTGLHRLMKLRWRWRRPQVRGVHALVLTPAGKMVLVRLRYAAGWRFPGGGLEAGEEPESGALRELREEIGLTAHSGLRLGFEEEDVIDHKNDRSAVFLVTGAAYAPRWSLEVEDIAEFPAESPPPDLSPRAARWLDRLRPLISG